MSVFDDVKSRVSCADAAAAYGFTPNRAGMIRCPFHQDRTPSLKVYPDHFHCYGCGAGGSVIDFVSRLFDIDTLSTVRKMNDDFSLQLQLDRPEDPEERALRRENANVNELWENWRVGLLTKLNAAHRTGYLAKKIKSMPEWTPAEALAIRYLETLADWADKLDSNDEEQQLQIFRDRKGIERLCQQILTLSSSTATRSLTA